MLEDRLHSVCDEISERKNLQLKQKDLKGSPIDRAKVFLNKVASIPQNQQVWQRLKDFQMIRDCIVHTNGYIEASTDKARIKELCKKGFGVSDVGGFLVLEKDYCIKTLEAIKTYFDHIFDSAGFEPTNARPDGARIKSDNTVENLA